MAKRPPHLIPERDSDVKRPDGNPRWPRHAIQTKQDEFEDVEAMAQAMWNAHLRRRNMVWLEAFKSGEKDLAGYDHKRVRWHELDDATREAWRVRAHYAWFEASPMEDGGLIKEIAAEIYALEPWCRPYERPGLTVGVGIVPFEFLHEHRVGRDIQRSCEVRARAAIRVLERHNRYAKMVKRLQAIKPASKPKPRKRKP